MSGSIPCKVSREFPCITAVIVFATGLAVLLGWALDFPLLRSVLPGAVEMKTNTALGLMLSAGALFILHQRSSPRWQLLAQVLAIVVFVLSLATLAEYWFGWQLHIDELLFRDTGRAYNAMPGRMSPFSAGAFAATGLALFVLRASRWRAFAWAPAIFVTGIGAISLLGYFFNAAELVTDRVLPPVAANAAMAFLLLGAGMIRVSRPTEISRANGHSIENKILLLFVAAMLILVTMSGFVYRNVANFSTDAQLVSHTQEVRAALGQVYGTISDAESAQRSAILTRNMRYKAEYYGFAAEVARQRDQLAKLVADNPVQTQNLETLSSLTKSRLRILDNHLALFDQEGLAAVRAAIERDGGIQIMQAIRSLIDRMDAVEAGLLAGREAALENGRQTTLAGILVALAVAASILITQFFGLRRQFFLRDRAQRELSDAAGRVAAIVDTVADGIVTIDAKGIVGSFNPAAERLFDYAAEDVVGRNISMLMPEPYRSQHDGYLARYKATGEAKIINIGREVAGQRKDGSTFPMYLGVGKMTLQGQDHYTGVVRDLTEAKAVANRLVLAKERAEAANMAKDSFLATMSHEIRTPLTGLLGMLELLSLTTLGKDQRRTLDVAWDSARSLLRIVSDILDWSKIEEGKLELSPRPTSIPELLASVVDTYSRVASTKALVVTHKTDSRLSPAHVVDALRLSQILNNFVSNAIKFTSRGEIGIRAELLERVGSMEKICISVQDTGIGIPQQVQGQLFQRYQQEHADIARIYGGTGLGLAICRRLAELMDGHLELESKLGVGSTFSIILTLPSSDERGRAIMRSQVEVAQKAVAPLSHGGEAAPLVLVVDDHPINRDLISQQLSRLGLRVETAENGKAALSMWEDGRFSLIITDCHMPELDGYGLTRAIRGIEAAKALPPTPIVAWTANVLAQEADRCKSAGMNTMLSKPADLRQLRNTVAKTLNIAEADNRPATPTPLSPGAELIVGPIDFSVLSGIVPDSARQMPVLLDFLAHIRNDLAKLSDAPDQRDLPAIESAAHRMKGSSRMVGAQQLATACEALEELAGAGDLAGAAAARPAVELCIQQIQKYLDEIGRQPTQERGDTDGIE